MTPGPGDNPSNGAQTRLTSRLRCLRPGLQVKSVGRLPAPGTHRAHSACVRARPVKAHRYRARYAALAMFGPKRGHVPEPHGLAGAAAGQSLAVRAERHRVNSASVPDEGIADRVVVATSHSRTVPSLLPAYGQPPGNLPRALRIREDLREVIVLPHLSPARRLPAAVAPNIAARPVSRSAAWSGGTLPLGLKPSAASTGYSAPRFSLHTSQAAPGSVERYHAD